MVAVTLDGLFDLVAVDGAPVELGSEVEVWGDEVGEGFEFAVVGAEVVVVGAVVVWCLGWCGGPSTRMVYLWNWIPAPP